MMTTTITTMMIMITIMIPRCIILCCDKEYNLYNTPVNVITEIHGNRFTIYDKDDIIPYGA